MIGRVKPLECPRCDNDDDDDDADDDDNDDDVIDNSNHTV